MTRTDARYLLWDKLSEIEPEEITPEIILTWVEEIGMEPPPRVIVGGLWDSYHTKRINSWEPEE